MTKKTKATYTWKDVYHDPILRLCAAIIVVMTSLALCFLLWPTTEYVIATVDGIEQRDNRTYLVYDDNGEPKVNHVLYVGSEEIEIGGTYVLVVDPKVPKITEVRRLW